MRKALGYIFTLTLVLGLFSLYPERVEATYGDPIQGIVNVAVNCAVTTGDINPIYCALKNFFSTIVGVILKFVSLLTGVAAIILNGVVHYTVVDVAKNYQNLAPLKEAWGVLRDIANMSFIFVLLYAGIRTILGVGENNKNVIVNVVVAAVLMNFSMFFTRVVIDISNIFALTFYDAIAPGSLNATGTFNLAQAGLSNAFTQYLSIQGLYQIGGSLNFESITTIGIMGSITLLISAFVFLAISMMFIIRYVVLILVIILSPVYFVAIALPKGTGIDEYKNQWLNALVGQAFFAPIYFLLTWVAIRVMSGVMDAFGGAQRLSADGFRGLSMGNTGAEVTDSAFAMFMNFAIVIVLMITSLLVAKKWADKAGSGMGKLTSWATSKAGGLTFGTAQRFGRTTIGRLGDNLADNNALKDAEARGGIRGLSARLALAASRKTAGASFDLRGTGVGSTLGGGNAGLGFKQARAKAIKEREERAENLKTEVTSADIEAEMVNRHGANWRSTFSTAQKAEGARRQVQYQLEAKAKKETLERQQEFINTMANSNQYIPGSGADKAAATKLRSSKGASMQSMARLAKIEGEINAASRLSTTTDDERKIAQDQFEKAIKDATNKEIEAIVESNRSLLESMEFANALNENQLEALTKNEKLSDDEKTVLKNTRFKSIYEGVRAAPDSDSVDGEVSKKIKGLSDAELEMFDVDLLSDPRLIDNLKSSQIESIGKSKRFTKAQRKKIKDIRNQRFLRATNEGHSEFIADPARRANIIREMVRKRLSGDDLAGLMSEKVMHTNLQGVVQNDTPVILLPQVLKHISSKTLKRMGEKMSSEDIQNVRKAILELNDESHSAEFGDKFTDEERKQIKKTAEWLDKDEGLTNFS